MTKKIICFSLGLSEEDMEKGRDSFCGMNRETPTLEVIPITEYMLSAPVGEILNSIMAASGLDDAAKRQEKEKTLSAEFYKYRVVIVQTPEREIVLKIMRSFKSVLDDPQNIIFAVITDTARTWTFGEYIGHLGAEHEDMMNRRPAI